ncbi:uncharacterized protein LOC112340731 [Selaginella moellendorffii]|uniref:uncharacterized protein LOC112340731 n=1 Tax=Selaginella moellendorffii TaxID=88036 RepID=UPI000D1CCBA5|nr:uncharacterized protein LOC112340731 [Selaginella moellendorffii]|eukprot:XP_024515428.1 uncharacterized protein LOC112340731 [Selaginella moellendorffii]
MESLLARALESKLKYWLRSFTRDQFKLQGRSVQLHNLDVDGAVLHSTLGLPPSLFVAQARVGKLELTIPYISNVKIEPIVVDIDKLDLVLAEKSDAEACDPVAGIQTNSSAKSTSYGFADQIADGMTIQVGTVNLMIETRGGSRGGAAWTPPLAAITMRGLSLYTTNEHWEVVNLREARNFSSDKKSIFVFKKLEWQSFSVDLLPHPDMFSDERLSSGSKDADGAKRLFFGGERFLDNISGTAYITMHRTEQNNPLGLEVQLLIPEAVCPALSEPGLRALLRFMTGFYVCLNRGDVHPTNAMVDESPSCTLVGVSVEHIFLGIKDADFRLELLAQSLRYKRASIPENGSVKTLGNVSLGGLFLRDMFLQPPCILVQPSMSPQAPFEVPTFASENLWPKIYPLDFHVSKNSSTSVASLYSSQLAPSPLPPAMASQTVIQCQPLKIFLQEKSCLQISSFLADGILVEPGVVRPNTSLNSMHFSLREFDLSVPMDPEKNDDQRRHEGFTGARLHVEGLLFVESPTLSYGLLKLDEDPACFSFWKGQLPDSSQKRWAIRANHVSVALETGRSGDFRLWQCIELKEPCLEVAMVTPDGLPLLKVPPPGGIVRLGISWNHFISNSSVEQLLFVLEMYSYLGKVGQALMKTDGGVQDLSKSKSFGGLIEAAPSDSAVTLGLDYLEIKFLESGSSEQSVEGFPLVKFIGSGIRFKVTHRTLGGAIAVSSTLCWQSVRVECVDTESEQCGESLSTKLLEQKNMRAILWVNENFPSAEKASQENRPFLDVNVVHMMPYRAEDADCHSLKAIAKISGVRLGGGMIYTESLLHRFGVFGPDGGPGEDLKEVLKRVSGGPLAHLFQGSHTGKISASSNDDHSWELKRPDNVEIDIQLIDWLFALQGVENIADEDACWHSTFKCLRAKGDHSTSTEERPPQRITVMLEGLQALKPRRAVSFQPLDNGGLSSVDISRRSGNDGLALEVRLVAREGGDGDAEIGIGEWIVDSVRAAVREPIEMDATKDELEFLVEIAKAEAEAASRITVGLLRLLQLQGSLGQAAIVQLSSLGSGSLDKLKYMSPERSRRASSISSVSCNSSTPYSSLRPREETREENINTTVLADQLEDLVCKSQNLCRRIEMDVRTTAAEDGMDPSSSTLNSVASLKKQLNQMQGLISSLRL